MKSKSNSNTSWFKSGSPWIWLNGGAVAVSMVMVIGLLALIAIRGFGHFWPADILHTTIVDREGNRHAVMGEAVRSEVIPTAVARDNGYTVPENVELVTRHLIKQGNRDVSSRDFMWYLETGMDEWEYPDQAIVIERREWGNYYGYPVEIREDGNTVSRYGSGDFWQQLEQRVERSVNLFAELREIEKVSIGRINNGLERLRLKERRLQLDGVSGEELAREQAEIAQRRAELDARYLTIKAERDEILARTKRDQLLTTTADGKEVVIPFEKIVRITRPNDMGVVAKSIQYLERFWEFLTDEPREANTEGGIFPAIFGTVLMTIIMAVIVMSIMVTPFGVLAAIYLREYARQGTVLRLIRISVYNLAGVPSIVYGVFGLGFFVYFLGGNIDQLFYPESLPAPTFGTPGLFWA